MTCISEKDELLLTSSCGFPVWSCMPTATIIIIFCHLSIIIIIIRTERKSLFCKEALAHLEAAQYNHSRVCHPPHGVSRQIKYKLSIICNSKIVGSIIGYTILLSVHSHKSCPRTSSIRALCHLLHQVKVVLHPIFR